MALRLVKRPGSPNWVIRGTVRGVRVEKSTGTSDKAVAEEICVYYEAQLLKESVYGKQVTATFAEAALSYVEAGGDKRFLPAIVTHFGLTLLGEIDQDAVDEAEHLGAIDCSGHHRAVHSDHQCSGAR